MATLAADKVRAYENTGGHPDYNELPIIADDIIYRGAAAGESTTTGTARPLVGGDVFLGFCMEQCDNAGGAASAKRVKLLQSGVIKLAVTGVDNVNDYDSAVYATDDDTFTQTASGGSSIGKVKRYNGDGTCMVLFEASSKRSI